MNDNINKLIDHLFRHESGKMVAVLSRFLGIKNLETAHDIVQDTLEKAMITWSYSKLPDDPTAWLYRVAKNKAIDYLRREKKFREITPNYSYLLESEYSLNSTANNLFLDTEIKDSQLRMMFVCCHPSIPVESQVALTLKTLCGLSVEEIAKGFLVPAETISKRIYRAKEKIRSENIEMTVPEGAELSSRLDVVLKSIYLLFSEGYNSSHPDQLIREDICQDAMRLCYLLVQNPLTNLPRTNALLALFCFQASRLDARLDDKGNIILLKYQNRNKWNKELMSKGFTFLELAAEPFEVTQFHIEAAIASIHAASPSFEETNWTAVHKLYGFLYNLQPAPIIAMNRAIASGYALDKRSALEELLNIKGLENYYLYQTSVGEMYFELQDKEKAKEHYESALSLTNSQAEKQLLQQKINSCN